MKFLKYSVDQFKSTQGSYIKYDKLEHFLLAFVGLFVSLFFFGFYAILFWSALGVLWECKDGLFTYDGKNIQGFSWKDLIADFLGFIFAILLWAIINNI